MKRFLWIVLAWMAALNLQAQCEQRVRVLEYNGREQKTALANVEVAVAGAGAVASDAEGNLTLRFRQLKAGDHVQLRRLDLSGYEVFNCDALEQWTISPSTVFTIVMCRSDRYRQLCDQYSSVASESYARQLKREKDRIEAERKAGKLKLAEYEQQLQEVQDRYDEQLERLDVYVERFAHIDLSELSEAEAAIVELVQQGEIEAAIERYEQMNLLEVYTEQSDDLRQISATQDSLTTLRENKVAARDTLRQLIGTQADLYERQGEQAKADSIRARM